MQFGAFDNVRSYKDAVFFHHEIRNTKGGDDLKKVFAILAGIVLFLSAGSAFAHGHHNDGGHNWRYNGNGGYYCDGGYGHGPNCRY